MAHGLQSAYIPTLEYGGGGEPVGGDRRIAGALGAVLTTARQRLRVGEILKSRKNKAAATVAFLLLTGCAKQASEGEFTPRPPAVNATVAPSPEATAAPEFTPNNVCDVIPPEPILALVNADQTGLAQTTCLSNPEQGIYTDITHFRNDGVYISILALNEAQVASKTEITDNQMSGMGNFEQYASFGQKKRGEIVATNGDRYPIAWDNLSARASAGPYSLHVQVGQSPDNVQAGYTVGRVPQIAGSSEQQLFDLMEVALPKVFDQPPN